MKKLLSLSLAIILCFSLLVSCQKIDRITLTGYYVRGVNGYNIIVTDDNTPVIMTNVTSDFEMFTNFTTGDKIKVTSSFVEEINPSKSKVYKCQLLEEGSPENLSEQALDNLLGFGLYKQ